MSSTAVLMSGMLFGATGLGFLLYGKNQKAIVPLIVGSALCIAPYFIANVYGLITVGAVLVAIPYFVRI